MTSKTESAHTKGPWHSGGHGFMADTRTNIYTGEGGAITVAQDVLYEDARLIAAAPELLEALIVLADQHAETIKECGGCDHSVGICCCADIRAVDTARALISKVRT